jgi:hypothetical protein
MEIRTQHKYAFNILVDLSAKVVIAQPGLGQSASWAALIFPLLIAPKKAA